MIRAAAVALFALAGTMGLSAAQPAGKQPAQPQLPAGHPQITAPRPGEEWPKADPADVASLDAIMRAFYESTSGEAGQPRQWERYKSLFLPEARLVAARPGEAGTAGAFFLTVGDFVAANRNYFEKGGFFDKEIARRTESFGNMTQVWSTYESRRKRDAAEPYVRGINSVQLLKDKDRWWIVNVFWEYERPDLKLPEKYLTTPEPSGP